MNGVASAYLMVGFLYFCLTTVGCFYGIRIGLVTIDTDSGRVSWKLALRVFSSLLAESCIWPISVFFAVDGKIEAMKALRTGKSAITFWEKDLSIKMPHEVNAQRQWLDLMERVSFALQRDWDDELAGEDPAIAWRVFQDAAWSALQVAAEKQKMPPEHRQYLPRLLMAQARLVTEHRNNFEFDALYPIVYAFDFDGPTEEEIAGEGIPTQESS